MTFGLRPIDPDLFDIITAHLERYELQHRGPMPGRVESYDVDAQTANVLPLLNYPVPQGVGTVVWEECPVVPSVPVVWPRLGAWFLAGALQPGDTVLLLPLEGSAGAWRAGDGAPQDPDDLRRHHLANCVALPGLYVRSRALARAPRATGTDGALTSSDAALVLGSDAGAARITLRPNGAVEIAQGDAVVVVVDPDGTVHLGGVAGDFVALAALVDARLSTVRAAFNAHTHVVTGASVTGGAVTGTAAAPVSPIPSLASTAATKAKAT